MNKDLTDLLTEFDEMGYAPTTLTGEPEKAASEWKKRLIEAIEAENAALRERLDKAVEFPVKIGDRVFCIVGQKPAVEEFEVIEIKTQSSSLLHATFRFQGIEVGYRTTGFLSGYGKRWFTELEAAEKRLAELGGEKNND